MRPGLSRRAVRPLVIKGMYGLGDNIMQRPFVRAAAAREGQVFLQTPWPELYADLPGVKPVRSMTRLRTQQKNERRVPHHIWARCPTGARVAKIGYGHAALERGNIYQAMDDCLPLGDAPFVMDLPRLRAPKIDTGGKPLAVIRPVTARREWLNPARTTSAVRFTNPGSGWAARHSNRSGSALRMPQSKPASWWTGSTGCSTTSSSTVT